MGKNGFIGDHISIYNVYIKIYNVYVYIYIYNMYIYNIYKDHMVTISSISAML